MTKTDATPTNAERLKEIEESLSTKPWMKSTLAGLTVVDLIDIARQEMERANKAEQMVATLTADLEKFIGKI